MIRMEKDDKDSLIQKYKERLEGKAVPPEIKEVIDQEMDKLNSLDKNSSEFGVARYLTLPP